MSSSAESTRMKKAKTVVELGPVWSMLLRIALVLQGLVVAWAVWVTTNQYADNADRTRNDELERYVYSLPPTDWRERIKATESAAQVVVGEVGILAARVDALTTALNEFKNDTKESLRRIEDRLDERP